LDVQGIKTPNELNTQEDEIINDIDDLGTKTLGDIMMQTLDGQDDFDLGNNVTCFESVAEKVLALDELETETSTLYLNNWIVDLKQQIHDLEALNQVINERAWQNTNDIDDPGTKTLGDIIMQTLDGQDDFDLGNYVTCFESVAEKVLALDELETKTFTLYLNNWIVDLKQQIHDLEALNQVINERAWQKKGKIELTEEVKEQK